MSWASALQQTLITLSPPNDQKATVRHVKHMNILPQPWNIFSGNLWNSESTLKSYYLSKNPYIALLLIYSAPRSLLSSPQFPTHTKNKKLKVNVTSLLQPQGSAIIKLCPAIDSPKSNLKSYFMILLLTWPKPLSQSDFVHSFYCILFLFNCLIFAY